MFKLVIRAAFLGFALSAAADGDEIDFNRDIRPILYNNCVSCHGPDEAERKGDLRLDLREAAVANVIKPNQRAESEFWRRISTDDADDLMPPPESGHALTDAQKELLGSWIDEGAPYAKHWSFTQPVKKPLPATANPEWARMPWDRFVQAQLENHQFEPSPRARKALLLRRASLDLTGLPPSLEEVEEFVSHTNINAFERTVDRLLASPAYGERWARVWLDLARYADSRGYGSDPLRVIWRYRDWVIEAFNRNLPFDQFTIEQIAGDLLPDPSVDQMLATAFHRNTLTNTLGGTIDEEFRVVAVKDRIETTSQVWMGVTMKCAQCHNHKFDPISQEEYYQLFAIFNQTEDSDRPNEAPTMPTPSWQEKMELERLKTERARLLAKLESEKKLQKPQPDTKGRFVRIEIPGSGKFLHIAELQVFRQGENLAPKGKARQSSTGFGGEASRANDGNTDGSYQKHSVTHTNQESNPWLEIDLGKDQPVERVVVWNRADGVQARLDGAIVSLLDARRETVWKKTLKKAPKREVSLSVGAYTAKDEIDALDQRIAGFKGTVTPVMRELPTGKQRPNHVMIKGNYLMPGKAVRPGTPAAFPPLPKGRQANRLGLAHWLVSRENPLTARVTVNRFWSQLFGRGLVETQEDFGSQGTFPSHPQLLDWLAVDLMDRGWDQKAFLRTIVLSSTYQQSSKVTEDHRQRDPDNRLLARGPRFRLEAEIVRDQALSLSGLLGRKMYGPSIYPPQPPGLWRAAFNGERKWATSTGEDRYRRGVYVFLRRSVPYPPMATFDAPNREICTARRIHTNTPLQAFVTLNDPAYVEMAQALARRLVKEGGRYDAGQILHGLRLVYLREPKSNELKELIALFHDQKAFYEAHPDKAEQMAEDPLNPLPEDLNEHTAHMAALTVVANVLLNLDALMMKN